MAYGQYAGVNMDDDHSESAHSQSESYNQWHPMASTTKHQRRMGTVKSTRKPVRLNYGSDGSVNITSSVPATPTPTATWDRSATLGRSTDRLTAGSIVVPRSRSQPPPISEVASQSNENVIPRGGSPPRTMEQLLSMTPFTTPKERTNALVVNGQMYAVLRVLGKGGSSIVYQVYDKEENFRAIKVVDLSEVDDKQAEEFMKEVKVLERLQKSDRVIKMFGYEYRESEKKLYVVLECGETDLAHMLKSISSITDVQRKYYWAEMLGAVKAIHEEGIVHSDLKPANFLLVKGILKLIDFGIASAVQSDKTSVIKENQMGTFNFMPPEVVIFDPEKGAKISKKSDVWSLGCILYNLTYGKLPFSDIREPLKKLSAIKDPNHKISFPREGRDPHLVNVLQRCLVRDVAQRASVDELLDHPYVTSNNHLDDVLLRLNAALTPNTRIKVHRAMQQIESGSTNYPPR